MIMLMKYAFKGLVAAGLVAGALTQVHASPVFTVDPSQFGAGSSFDADYISGGASTLLQATSATTVSGRGYTTFGNFHLGADQLLPGQTQLGNTYRLWAEYSFTTSLTSGSLLSLGSGYDITSLTFKLYGDIIDGTDPSFVAAAVGNAASGTVTGGNKVELGSGTLNAASPLPNVAEINGAGGTSLNAMMNFVLTAAGSNFFIDPVPFYDFVFSSFTNTSQGVVIGTGANAGRVSINNASGGVDFAGVTEVPEPASMALIGLGLIGVAAARRRQTKK
jgi:hypothetical protein